MATVTKGDILSGLREMGVVSGMEIEVHSSLSSFGHVEGGENAVIDALIEAVGSEGSLFMPALRLSRDMPLTEEDRRLGLLRKIQILPPDEKHTAMGRIADAFRFRPDTVLGEGVFRICGWGKSAAQAKENGLQYLLDNGGKGLLLGVDIYSLTAMHYVEDLLPKEIGKVFEASDEAKRVYPPDQWFIESGEPPVKPWYTIQNIALERGYIRRARIGDSPCMFFDLWSVVGLYREKLIEDPLGLYGLR